ncbi:vagC protein [Klebsiella pneumoniae]|nr:vagC protein [Klebsiella pneumoniae]
MMSTMLFYSVRLNPGAGDRGQPGREQHHPAPVRPTWGSFAQPKKADPDFMAEREDIVIGEGRVKL